MNYNIKKNNIMNTKTRMTIKKELKAIAQSGGSTGFALRQGICLKRQAARAGTGAAVAMRPPRKADM